MHPEIAACARLLARLSYIMGDYSEVSRVFFHTFIFVFFCYIKLVFFLYRIQCVQGNIITSREGGNIVTMLIGLLSVHLSVCLSVCEQGYPKCLGTIFMTVGRLGMAQRCSC